MTDQWKLENPKGFGQFLQAAHSALQEVEPNSESNSGIFDRIAGSQGAANKRPRRARCRLAAARCHIQVAEAAASLISRVQAATTRCGFAPVNAFALQRS